MSSITLLPHRPLKTSASNREFIKIYCGFLAFLTLLGLGLFVNLQPEKSPKPDTLVEVFFAAPVVENPTAKESPIISPRPSAPVPQARNIPQSSNIPSFEPTNPSPSNPVPSPQSPSTTNTNPTPLQKGASPSNPPNQPESAGDVSNVPETPSGPQILDRPPKLLAGPAPTYPPSALRRELEGTVIALITTAPDGTVKEVEILQSAGRDFDRAVISAAQQAKFEAPIYKGQAVSARFQRSYVFSLSD